MYSLKFTFFLDLVNGGDEK